MGRALLQHRDGRGDRPLRLLHRVNATDGTCTGQEGIPGDRERADGDDNACFPASASLLVRVSGCNDSNIGFDGTSYQKDWPDGNRRLYRAQHAGYRIVEVPTRWINSPQSRVHPIRHSVAMFLELLAIPGRVRRQPTKVAWFANHPGDPTVN